MAATIDSSKCTKCQECVDTCPVECITGNAGGMPSIEAADCVECGACESACPVSAISMG